MVPDIQLAAKNGALNAELYYDSTQSQAKAKLSSTLDLTVFSGIFGEGADRFFASCRFPQKGPTLNLTATGTTLKLEDLVVKGSLNLGAFLYKTLSSRRQQPVSRWPTSNSPCPIST